MARALKYHGNVQWGRLRREAATRLVATAEMVAAEHAKRLMVPNPLPLCRSPAKRGEYPRRRTGALVRMIEVKPANPTEAAKELSVSLGYRGRPAVYGEALERRGWSGWAKTLADLRGRIAAGLSGSGGGGRR